MRTQVASAAEQQVVVKTAQTEEKLNIQKLVDKHTKDLKVSSKCHQIAIADIFNVPVNILIHQARCILRMNLIHSMTLFVI